MSRFCAAIVSCLVLVGNLALAEIRSDVIYGHKDGMALVYDVFQATEPNGAGVVFMVSGGWFSVWQPAEYRLPRFQGLLDEGFTVFAVHHGSAPRFKVPDAVSDVRAALRHIKVNAAEYGVDESRLGVWGGSAGGHLALMLGLDSTALPASPPAAGRGRMLGPHYKSANGDASVAAVVAYYPPADLRSIAGPSERFPALDFPSSAAAAISPILFVSAEDPPTLLVHGDADELVAISNSEILTAEMEQVGVVHDFIVIDGGVHGFRDPIHRREAYQAMLGWFKTHLRSEPVKVSPAG